MYVHNYVVCNVHSVGIDFCMCTCICFAAEFYMLYTLTCDMSIFIHMYHITCDYCNISARKNY